MGLLIPEDREYNEERRQVGFNRYKQLLSRHFKEWLVINAITLLGALPLVGGILISIAASSILLLIPCSALGGMIFGPFLSGLYDSMLRRMRDDVMPWRMNYAKSWKQNALGSLLPGAILGVMTGLFCFMGMLFWWAVVPPALSTIVLYLLSMLLALTIVNLYWPQLVLFRQSGFIRLRNCLLFTLQNFLRVFGTALLQLGYFAFFLLFAPWTLLVLPVIGIWYPVFFSQHLLYDRLNDAFEIEESFRQAESERS
ncbi:MAG: hypothetical protein IJZ39_10285 [Oscillospiraceae bacterium]|nr:hypothetical protein [Oscillospiraceae bacterium]